MAAWDLYTGLLDRCATGAAGQALLQQLSTELRSGLAHQRQRSKPPHRPHHTQPQQPSHPPGQGQLHQHHPRRASTAGDLPHHLSTSPPMQAAAAASPSSATAAGGSSAAASARTSMDTPGGGSSSHVGGLAAAPPRLSLVEHGQSDGSGGLLWALPSPRRQLLLLGLDVQQLLAHLQAAAAEQAAGGSSTTQRRLSSSDLAGGHGGGAASSSQALQLTALTALALLHRWGLDGEADAALLQLLGEEGLLAAAVPSARGVWCGDSPPLSPALSLASAGASMEALPLLGVASSDGPAAAAAAGPLSMAAPSACLAQEVLLAGHGALVLSLPYRLEPHSHAQRGRGGRASSPGPSSAAPAAAAPSAAVAQHLGTLAASHPVVQSERLLALVALGRWLMSAGAAGAGSAPGGLAPPRLAASLGSRLVTLYALQLQQLPQAMGHCSEPDLQLLAGAWAAGGAPGAGAAGSDALADAAQTLLGALLQPRGVGAGGAAGAPWSPAVLQLATLPTATPPGTSPQAWLQQLLVAAATCVAHPQAAPRDLLAAVAPGLLHALLAAAPAAASTLAAGLLAQALSGPHAALWLQHLGTPAALLHRCVVHALLVSGRGG